MAKQKHGRTPLPIFAIRPTGEIIDMVEQFETRHFESSVEAADALKVVPSTINRLILNGKNHLKSGWCFDYQIEVPEE